MSYKRAGYGGFDRRSGAYKSMRKQFKAHCKQVNAPCWLCAGSLGPIDYGARGGIGAAFELDHIVPVSTRPELAMQWSNLAASHSSCNRSRQAKDVDRRDQGRTAAWVKPSW